MKIKKQIVCYLFVLISSDCLDKEEKANNWKKPRCKCNYVHPQGCHMVFKSSARNIICLIFILFFHCCLRFIFNVHWVLKRIPLLILISIIYCILRGIIYLDFISCSSLLTILLFSSFMTFIVSCSYFFLTSIIVKIFLDIVWNIFWFI